MTIKDQYEHYRSFHQDPRNQLVHIFGIPVINWTAFVIFSYLSVNLFLNFTLVVAVAGAVYYSTLNRNLGIVSVPVFTVMWLTSYLFYYFVPFAYLWAILGHVLSWVAQILSHHYFEGNQPAVLDNLFGSLTMAPAFWIIEVSNRFGYLTEIEGQYSTI